MASEARPWCCPPAIFSTLNLLAASVNGNHASQTFTVTYTDGSKTILTQSLSDWYTPQYYSGESIALTMAYHLNAAGAAIHPPVYLYAYSPRRQQRQGRQERDLTGQCERDRACGEPNAMTSSS